MKETLTAFSPEAEVDTGDFPTSDVDRRLQWRQFEDIFGDFFDVVATVADNST